MNSTCKILLCAREKQIFISNYKNGASQEGTCICFPVRRCCQHPTAKSGFKIQYLVYPEESINVDSEEESTGFGWKLQQLLYAGICGIPVFQVLSAWRHSALGSLRHRSVTNNCGTWEPKMAGQDSGSELSIFCLLRAVDISKLSFISSCFSELLWFAFCICMSAAVWLSVAFWHTEETVIQLTESVTSENRFLWLSYPHPDLAGTCEAAYLHIHKKNFKGSRLQPGFSFTREIVEVRSSSALE